MRRTLRILFISLIVLVLLAAGVFVFLPWKDYAAPAIAHQLRARGLPIESFQIKGISRDGVVLRPLVLATDPPLVLPEVALEWSLAGISTPQLKTLTLRGLRYTLRPGSSNSSPEAPTIPADPAFFAQIPLSRIRIEDAGITMAEKTAAFTLPFSGALELQPVPHLTLRSDGAEFASGDSRLQATSIALDLTLNGEKKRWEGVLKMAALTDVSETPSLPVLKPEVKLTLGESTVTAKAASGEYRGNMTYNLKDKSAKLSSLSLPFAGGKVEASPFTYRSGTPFAADFIFTGIDLQTALGMLMEKSGVSAQGTLDGTIPLRLENGIFSLGAGELAARDAGQLAVSAESLGALAGAGGQAENVALLLGDFRFQLLKIDFEPAPNNEVVARLKLEGNNPNVYDGKRVNLNVTLTGDVMKSLRSSMELLNAPQEWIKKEMRDEK